MNQKQANYARSFSTVLPKEGRWVKLQILLLVEIAD